MGKAPSQSAKLPRGFASSAEVPSVGEPAVSPELGIRAPGDGKAEGK